MLHKAVGDTGVSTEDCRFGGAQQTMCAVKKDPLATNTLSRGTHVTTRKVWPPEMVLNQHTLVPNCAKGMHAACYGSSADSL